MTTQTTFNTQESDAVYAGIKAAFPATYKNSSMYVVVNDLGVKIDELLELKGFERTEEVEKKGKTWVHFNRSDINFRVSYRKEIAEYFTFFYLG